MGPGSVEVSGLLALCGRGLEHWSADGADDLLLRNSWRGRERVGGVDVPGPEGSRALLRCVRDEWECSLDHAGPALVGESGAEVRVICDATLLHTAGLEDRLRKASVTPRSRSSADLIAAAWRAFGRDCADVLEGDWAFVLHDARTDEVFAARDPFGARSLFHRLMGEALFLASTPHPLAALTDRPPPFDPEGVLRAIWQQDGDGTRTGWLGIRELAAGTRLSWRPGSGPPGIQRFWTPEKDPAWASLVSEEAPEALARLLEEASVARMAGSGVALAMSGGQDSTAVLASLHGGGASQGPVHIVSLRYPPGDPGNEDLYVKATAEHFGLPIHWVDTAPLDLLAHERDQGEQRSLPAGHAFEAQNRALAARARELGVRVLMNGHGGDNLLWVSDWFMADLLRSGRWLSFRRAFRARGYRGVSHFLHYGLRPALPLRVYDMLGRLRGRPIHARVHERPLPPWVVAEPSLIDAIRGKDRDHHDHWFASRYGSVTDQRRAWGLGFAAFPRVCAALFDLVRGEGVELRMPFYDRRLVAFALARPPEEFNRPGEAKVLLRRAMRGRLPDLVVDPRPQGHKTGTAERYFRERFDREVERRHAELFPGASGSADSGGTPVETMVPSTPSAGPVSQGLGIVDPVRLARAIDAADADHRRWDVPTLASIHTEGWLQAQVARALPNG